MLHFYKAGIKGGKEIKTNSLFQPGLMKPEYNLSELKAVHNTENSFHF